MSASSGRSTTQAAVVPLTPPQSTNNRGREAVEMVKLQHQLTRYSQFRGRARLCDMFEDNWLKFCRSESDRKQDDGYCRRLDYDLVQYCASNSQ